MSIKKTVSWQTHLNPTIISGRQNIARTKERDVCEVQLYGFKAGLLMGSFFACFPITINSRASKDDDKKHNGNNQYSCFKHFKFISYGVND